MALSGSELPEPSKDTGRPASLVDGDATRTATGGRSPTVTAADAELLVGTRSTARDPTVAVLVRTPAAFALALIVRVASAPAISVPRSHTTTDVPEQVPNVVAVISR